MNGEKIGKNELYEKMKNCIKCGSGKYSPFCFKISTQKVAVITACPSMQAEYKPFTSIRFFRKLCIALFGDSNVSSQYIDAFFNEDGIYWTHYHKCYNPKNNDFSSLPNKCANEYLKTEMELLKPDVIIVFGDEIKDQVCEAIKEIKCSTLICKPFPEKGNESIYDEVRDVVKKYVGCIDFTNNICGKYIYENDDSINSDVHIKFEFDALKQILSNDKLPDAQRIEQVWHEKIVVPNMKMYEKVMLTYSFIENQIKVSLFDYVVKTGNCTFLNSVKKKSVAVAPKTYSMIANEIRESGNLLKHFEDYVHHIHKKENFPVINKLEILRRVRNCIVHEYGYIKNPKDFPNRIDELKGFKILGKTIYIDECANDELLSIAKETVELLK